MNYSDYVIYVDESGDHSPTAVDEEYPVFVLDFCIFKKSSYSRDVVPRVQEFKFDQFGHDIVVLHEYDIRRQKGAFAFLKNRDRSEAFMTGLNDLVAAAEFEIIAAVIDKKQLARRDVEPGNLYELALTYCLERAYRYLRGRAQHELKTYVLVERRGKREDDELELAFRRICDGDNAEGPMPNFEIAFPDKKTNSTGLQLADLTARPIGRHVIEPAQRNRAWDIIESKVWRNTNGETREYGLTVYPQRAETHQEAPKPDVDRDDSQSER